MVAGMTVAADFERRILEVVHVAERWVRHTSGKPGVELLPPATSQGERERELALVLGAGHDEIELLWSAIAFAIEPRVAVQAQLVFGPDTSGVTLAQHIAWRDLPQDRRRALAGVLDARHPLRDLGLLVPARPGPVNVWTPLTVARRAIDYLHGEDEFDPSLGIVWADHLHHSADQRTLIDRLRGWLGDSNALTIVVEGAVGSGRASAIAAAAAPRRALTANLAAVPPSQAVALLTTLRREALLCDAIPILANLDELWARVPPGDELVLELAATLDRLAGPVAITTSGPGLELRSERRTLVRARWPLPDPAARRVLWETVLGDVRPDVQLDELAHRYALGPGGIAAAEQLAKLFEAAEAGHALVLFDEADALFAKRSAEVKSATDRYANLEVNYLLQRIESFGGVVILTTNLDASIDPALRRRLASHIVFALPDQAERVRLWREMLSTGAPVERVDFRRLAAEFEHLTGANIRNAVLAAAFLAAEEGCSIAEHHLLRAARGEYRAMGRGLARPDTSGL